MDELWDRVVRLAGSMVTLLGVGENRLFVAEVHADVVLVQPEVSKTRRRIMEEPLTHRIPRDDIEVAAGLVQPGVPLTANIVRGHIVRHQGDIMAYPGYVVAIVRAALEETTPE